MWKNFVDPDRPETTSINTRISRAITKAIDTNSPCVTLIVFTQQQWLHETLLNVTFIHTLPALFLLKLTSMYSHMVC